MRRLLLIIAISSVALLATAQPAARRNQQQQAQTTATQGTAQTANTQTLSTRARISFPTAAPMAEDVVWRRDIYRELNLEEDANAGLYYPVEPVGNQMNLFTYIFKLMLRGDIKAYEYRLDGNELFTESARVKPLAVLDNYHIYYERNNGRLRIDNSDIPSREVRGFYIKESAYYDQASATFHTKVLALCPIMMREDDFGDSMQKYPLFWIKYDELAPFLSKQTIMTSNLNNAATMSMDDYFTRNMYRGKIYKTNNMLGRTLSQYCPDEASLTAEQRRIEQELKDFEAHLFTGVKNDTVATDSTAVTTSKKAKKSSTNRRASSSSTTKSSSTAKSSSKSSSKSSGSAAARVSVRRERH